VLFFSKLEDWSEIFGLFLTVLLPWSLFSALIAAAAAGMAGWMMRDRAWHPRWRRRLFAASLLLYTWRYLPWLTAPRVDGKEG